MTRQGAVAGYPRWLVVLVASAAFGAIGLLWAVATPLMNSPDEPTHALRAAAVWHGQLHGRDEVTHNPPAADGSVVSGTLTHVSVPRAYVLLRTMTDCYKFRRLVAAGCAPTVSTDTTMVAATTYVGTYPPTYYVLVGWPTRLFGPYRAIYAMRAVSALMGAVLLGLGLVSAQRAARSPFTVVGAAVAAVPQALFLIATINPSGLEIAAAFATWLGLLELARGPARPSRALIAQVVVTASLLAATRPLSPIFLGLVVATVALAAIDRGRLRELASDRGLVVGSAVVMLVTAASGAWIVSTHAYDAFTGISIPGLTPGGAAREHLHMFGFRTRQTIGYFGNVDAPLPDAIIWLWVGATGVLVAAGLWLGRWLQRLAILGLLGLVVAIPLISEMSRAPTYGFIWQGRYSLPIALGLPILGAWVVADRISHRGTSITRPAVAVVAVAVATGQLASHLAFMTRVIVGYPNPWWRYLSGNGWHPPLSVWLLLAWAGVSAGAYGAVVWLVGRDGRGPAAAHLNRARDRRGGTA